MDWSSIEWVQHSSGVLVTAFLRRFLHCAFPSEDLPVDVLNNTCTSNYLPQSDAITTKNDFFGPLSRPLARCQRSCLKKTKQADSYSAVNVYITRFILKRQNYMML